jgi:exosome complex exonuclease DIS3/RRP44
LNKSLKEQSMKKIKVVLISDDANNRNKAAAEGIVTFSISEYIKSLQDASHLQDKLCIKDYSTESDAHTLFPPHLTVVQIHEGIKNGKLYQGSFVASRENFLEGSVNVETFEKPVSLNRN